MKKLGGQTSENWGIRVGEKREKGEREKCFGEENNEFVLMGLRGVGGGVGDGGRRTCV